MSSSSLDRLPFLHGAPRRTIAAVKRVLRPLSVTAGTVLFRTGDPGDTCFLVERGTLRVLTAPDGDLLATLGAGSFVGELAVLLGEPRSATVIADTDADLLALERRDLDALMNDHPSLALAINRELGRRIVATNERFAGSRAARRSIVWPPAKVGPLAAAMAASGRRVGMGALAGASLTGVGGDAVRVKAPTYGSDDPALDAVLVGVGEAPSARAHRVVAEAQHALCFGPPPAWLRDAIPAGRVVRLHDDAAGMRRAARWAAGRSVGLALSSGGSKTVAHMGVLVALRDAGIEIDAVAGASGGAIAAAALAFGNSEQDAVGYLADLARFTHWRHLDLNMLPRSGLWKGRKLRDMFATWRFAERLEDANIPLWLVAADVATGRAVVMHEGPTADAIRASMSIPGMLDPWRVGDQVLIDGAVANPLPTDVLRGAGVGIVLASNVAGQATEVQVNGKLPGLNQIMGRVLNTMERERIRTLLPLADVVIRPRVTASNSFDFSDNDGFIDAGAHATKLRLDDIRTLVDASSQ